MARLRGSVTVEAMDVELLQAVAARVGERLRALTFEDGVCIDPVTGSRREGLQVIAGIHPRGGTRYRLVTEPPTVTRRREEHRPPRRRASDDSSGPDWSATEIDLVADQPRGIDLLVRHGPPQATLAAITIGPRDHPAHVHATVEVALTDPWPIRGSLRIEVDGRVERSGSRLLGTSALLPRGTAVVSHPRARGHVSVEVHPVEPDRWEIRVAASFRGRFLFRPVTAVALRLGRAQVRAGFDDMLRELAVPFRDLNRDLRAPDGSLRSPDDVAAEIVAGCFETVPATMPPDAALPRGAAPGASPGTDG